MEATNNNGKKEADVYRRILLDGLPVEEHQVEAREIATAYLEGGQGTPLVLLHGPGESVVWWMRVLPHLVKKFKVIVPDLPGHGSSGLPGEKLNQKIVLDWLGEFLLKTFTSPPVLIGHIAGGAIAARYAIRRGQKLKWLVLVDSLGLSAFRPAPRFALEFLRFMASPTEKSYLRFLPQCIYDMNELSRGMGKYWQPFLDYNLAAAKDPEKRSAAKRIMRVMSGKMPGDDLAKIAIPVTLIWGRHDKANRLDIAIKASKKYGWPLQVIEDSRDDPKLEKPDAFVKVLEPSIAEPLAEKQG